MRGPCACQSRDKVDLSNTQKKRRGHVFNIRASIDDIRHDPVISSGKCHDLRPCLTILCKGIPEDLEPDPSYGYEAVEPLRGQNCNVRNSQLRNCESVCHQMSTCLLRAFYMPSTCLLQHTACDATCSSKFVTG